MRAEIRALDQANQNVQNGSALLKTGADGISNIVDNLRSLKELAINAANDSNTNADRIIIQTEFAQRIANINDIALKTNYNDIALKTNYNDIALKTNYNGRVLLDGTYSKKSSATTETSQGTETTQIVGATIISAGDYTITEDGVYSLADGYTGTVTVNAQNVKLTQETPATQLNNVSIVTRAEGNSNLWIEGLNIANTEDKNIIKFQGADNYLTVKDTNIIENNTHNIPRYCSAIYIGGGLKIVGDGSLSAKSSTNGAAIGDNLISSSSNFIPLGDLIIGDNVTITATGQGVAIGNGGGMSRMGNILIGGNANVTATSFYGAGIGCGSFGGSGNNPSWVGDITISRSVTVDAYSQYASPIGIGSGNSTSTIGTISNGETTFDITLDLGIVAQVEPTTNSGTDTTSTDTTHTEEIFGNPLRIQSGTTADDFINVFIEDMRTKALGVGKLFDAGGNLINASDIAQYNALSNDSTKQAEWLATLKAAEDKTLDDVSLTTRDNAIVAIRIIDGLIDYALNQATSLGAMDNRLGYTADNIVTINENTQAAESTIRDADMAKTITNYAKYNLLTRIAQEMFAQANQNSNAVLGLLR